eukprot:1051805-Alexandrium_andersonii.AAC.1
MPRYPQGFKAGERTRDLTDHEREVLAGIPMDLLMFHLQLMQWQWQYLQAQESDDEPAQAKPPAPKP